MQNTKPTLIEERQNDFLAMVRRNNVWVVKNCFDGDVDKFINTPMEFVKFHSLTKSQKDKCYAEVYKNISVYNSNGFSKADMQTIFGTDSANKRIAYGPLVAALEESGRVYKRNHGTLVIKDNRRIPFSTFYILPQEELKAIFSNADRVDDILDLDSGMYTKRQQRIIRTIFTIEETNTMSEDNDSVFMTPMKKRKRAKRAKKPVAKKRSAVVQVPHPTDDVPTNDNFLTHAEVVQKLKRCVVNGILNPDLLKDSRGLGEFLTWNEYNDVKTGWTTEVNNRYMDAKDTTEWRNVYLQVHAAFYAALDQGRLNLAFPSSENDDTDERIERVKQYLVKQITAMDAIMKKEVANA